MLEACCNSEYVSDSVRFSQIQSDLGVDSVSLLLEEALSVVPACERHLKTIYVILVCGSERRGQPS